MNEEIAFTREYQAKILGLMLHDNEFRLAVRDHVLPEHFGSHVLQWFYDKLTTDTVHSKTTLKEELIKASKAKTIREIDIDSYVEIFSLVKEPVSVVDTDHIKNTVSKFIRTQSVKSAVLEALDLMKGDHWDEIAERMTTACSAGISVTDGGMRYLSQVDDRLTRRENAAPHSHIPVGVPELDSILNGGIEVKQLGFVAGGTGRGKSLFLQWMAKTALLLGKKVVYFTLELSEDNMAARFDAMLSGVKFSDINYHNTEISNTMHDLHAKFGDNLVIKEYPEDTATINTLKSFLMRLNSTGFVPDLVIVDYLDLLKPHRTYNETHEEAASIAKALRGLAKTLGTRIWTASQLNRAGIIMENPDETAISGAVAKLFTADIAVFMAQTKEEKMNNQMRLIVMKNRNGMSQRSVTVLQDYSYMTFYKEAYELDPSPTKEEAKEVTTYSDDDEAYIG